MREREILTEAVALVSRSWCQGAAARDRKGRPVDFTSSEAYSFCALGAIERACGSHVKPGESPEQEQRRRLRMAVEDSLGLKGEGLASWNDRPGRTKEEVVLALERVA